MIYNSEQQIDSKIHHETAKMRTTNRFKNTSRDSEQQIDSKGHHDIAN